MSVDVLLYLLFAALGSCLGWQAHSLKVERDTYRRDEERDREWDQANGIVENHSEKQIR